MKTLRLSLLCGMILLAAPAFTQTSQSDSQTLKDILTEIRAMRNEQRLNQTTQLLIAELQIQNVTVNSVLQRRDSVRSELAQIEVAEKERLANIARLEDEIRASSEPKVKEVLVESKEASQYDLAILKLKEEPLTTSLQEIELRLKREESALDNIQAQLGEVVKKLQPVRP